MNDYGSLYMSLLIIAFSVYIEAFVSSVMAPLTSAGRTSVGRSNPKSYLEAEISTEFFPPLAPSERVSSCFSAS